MYIKGLQKTTLLDFPSKVACTIFTAGCNFRCPFCHNASLVLDQSRDGLISEDEILSFLSKRKGILDGVCITGGEPLLQHDIVPFINKIRDMGFAVKLDTNGAFPERLSEIIQLGIVDYIAMDIKSSPSRYAEACGISKNPDGVFESIKIIMNANIPYEFRTTVVRELHTENDIRKIGELIRGAERYYLQAFKDSGELIGKGFSAHCEETMKSMQKIAAQYVSVCEIRGI